MDVLKNSLIDPDTLLVISHKTGEPIGHITEFPGLYKSIDGIQSCPQTGLTEEQVSVMYIGTLECGVCGSEDEIGYACTKHLEWGVTFCRQDGIVWRKLSTPLIH